MSTNELLPLLVAVSSGFMLGLIFFGGLWWTIRRMLRSPRPALWMLGSLWLRAGFALSGFWLIAGHDWERLLGCLAGFFIARLALTGPPRICDRQQIDVAVESSRASEP